MNNHFPRPKSFVHLTAILLCILSGGCGPRTAPSNTAPISRTAEVDAARIEGADRDAANWLTYGRTYSEQRFSPLKAINAGNVSQLGLVWHFDLDTRRGQEATPIVVDGTMYFTSAWSKVFALDAATGAPLWAYDPKVPPEWGVNACCDVVNRGVAVWHGKVIFATLDGRLIALDAATGRRAWETLTIYPKFRYTITGAPRVVKGKVIIGNGAAEMGVRGWISARGPGYRQAGLAVLPGVSRVSTPVPAALGLESTTLTHGWGTSFVHP